MIPSFASRHFGGRVLWTAAAAAEVGALALFVIEPGAPVISAPDPLPGDFSTDREADRRTHVLFRYTRRDAGARVWVWCRVGIEWLAIYDGEAFLGIFDGFSAVTQVSDNVFDFDLHPAGGWWGEVNIRAADAREAGVL